MYIRISGRERQKARPRRQKEWHRYKGKSIIDEKKSYIKRETAKERKKQDRERQRKIERETHKKESSIKKDIVRCERESETQKARETHKKREVDKKRYGEM